MTETDEVQLTQSYKLQEHGLLRNVR